MYGTVKKRTNLYVLRSTGNAYDVISHRPLSGPRAPPIFWTSLRLCQLLRCQTIGPKIIESLIGQCMMLNADVRKGGGGLVKCGHLRTGEKGRKGVIFADVLYGRPLNGSVL